MAGSPVPTISISASDLHLANAPTGIQAAQVSAVLGAAYTLAGIVAVLVIIIGGIRYVASNGDSGQITAAKNMVLYAVVGLVVVILASAITQFVIQSVK